MSTVMLVYFYGFFLAFCLGFFQGVLFDNVQGVRKYECCIVSRSLFFSVFSGTLSRRVSSFLYISVFFYGK